MFTPHLFPTLRSTTHLVSKNSPKSFPGQRIASIQRKAMPFIPGPRRAEMDENGERTYFCSWDGESCQPRLSTPRTTGVDERGKSHSTVGAPQQSDQQPSIFLRSGVIHTPLFPPKPDPSAFIGYYRLLFRPWDIPSCLCRSLSEARKRQT